MEKIDVAYLLVGVIGLWILAEIWSTLKHILYELNPRRKPLKRRRGR